MKKFIIFTPSYKETSGGIVVLHKLCHLLNSLGYEAYLYPYYESFEVSHKNFFSVLFKMVRKLLISFLKGFKTNPDFVTPILNRKIINNLEEYIVIYPEIVFGNPLRAKNVIRWLLHQPGFHTGKVFYGENELYYKFNSAIKDFTIPGSEASSHELKVIHYPLELYNLEGVSKKRSGTAYCLRKGRNKEIIHDLKNSVLIDNKSHREVAEIFKKIDVFISYDTYTAYSLFAVLCGAKSVVIPDKGVSVSEWYPDKADRNGIAYGYIKEEIKRASESRYLVLDRVIREENASIERVQVFATEAQEYFKEK